MHSTYCIFFFFFTFFILSVKILKSYDMFLTLMFWVLFLFLTDHCEDLQLGGLYLGSIIDFNLLFHDV